MLPCVKLMGLTSLETNLALATDKEISEAILLLDDVTVTYDTAKKHLIDVNVI